MNLDLLEKAAAECTACSLHSGRINPVFAKGNPKAKIMICGMVPADDENNVGLPFVGRAGQLLDKILADLNWTLEDVYITNLVKCYLRAGLPLHSEWIDSCLPYLITQIGQIEPEYIITLGKDASITLLGMARNVAMGKIRGQIHKYGPTIKVIPTYHPSYLLRGGGTGHRDYGKVLKDFSLAALDK
jgi:uracil-DNA glycosylase family 4